LSLFHYEPSQEYNEPMVLNWSIKTYSIAFKDAKIELESSMQYTASSHLTNRVRSNPPKTKLRGLIQGVVLIR
jgi:hypothetical protein